MASKAVRVVGTKLDYRGFASSELPPQAKSLVAGAKVASSPLSPFSLAHAVEFSTGQVELDLTCQEQMTDWRHKQQQLQQLSFGHTPEPHPAKLPPWDHQVRAYAAIELFKTIGLFMYPGTGKTKVAYDWMENHPGFNVVVCPKTVILEWKMQYAVHTHETMTLVSSEDLTRPKLLQAIKDAALSGKPAVVLINYDKIWREGFRELFLKIADKIDCLVLDEVHKVKSPGSRQSKFLQLLSSRVNGVKLGLTGTPIPETPLDIYGIYRVLDPSIFGESHQRFEGRYARVLQLNRFTRKVIGLNNEDELAAKIAWLSIQVKNDVLQLPEQRHIPRFFSLPPKVKEMYDEFEKELCVELNEKYLAAPSRVAALTKLQQIAGGFVIHSGDGDAKFVDNLHSGKLDLLKEIIEELEGHKVVVFCRYTAEVQAISEYLSGLGRVGQITGARKDYPAWKRGELDYLVCQISAASTGVDFTEACYTIYYSMSFSNADYIQSLARTHRAGQKNNVVYYYLMAANTVDHTIFRALSEKQEVVEACLQNARQHRSQLLQERYSDS